MKTLTIDSKQQLDLMVALYNYRSAYTTALEKCNKNDYRQIADYKNTINNVNSIIVQLEK